MRPLVALLAAGLFVFARPASAQSSGQPDPPLHRYFVDVNLLGSAYSNAQERLFQNSAIVFGEVATYKVRYPKPTDERVFPLLDVGGGFNVNRTVGFGVQFAQTSFRDGAGLEATIPHPYYLQVPATGTGQTASLDRTESAWHVFITLTALRTRKTEWRFSGGPSIITYSENMVSEILYSQTATPDSQQNVVTISGYNTQKVTGTAVGAHISSDFAYSITRLIAITGGVRASSGTVTIKREPMTQLGQDIRVGGWQVLLGLRFRLGTLQSK